MGVMVPEANPYRCIHCTGTCNLGCARSIEETIKYEDPDSIAAMIVEPVPKGALVSPPEYWDMVKDLCAKHDILLIADEVVTGFEKDRNLVRRRPLGPRTRPDGSRQDPRQRLPTHRRGSSNGAGI